MCHYLVFKDQARPPDRQPGQYIKDAFYIFLSALLSITFLVILTKNLIFLLAIDDRVIGQGKQYI